MPTYEYACNECGRFEVFQKITEDPLEQCPHCGGSVKRLISRNVNIIFKGSGFHATDYRTKSYTDKASAEGKSGGKDTGKSETASPDGAKSTGGESGTGKGDNSSTSAAPAS